MSGYDKRTGVFELTATKASYWLRRETPEELGVIESCVFLLRQAGFEILKQGSGFIRIKATPEQVWETLSGKPSDPEHAKQYY